MPDRSDDRLRAETWTYVAPRQRRRVRRPTNGENEVCYNGCVLDTLTIDDFKPHVGTSFHVDGSAIDLVLERVAAVMESEHARLKRTAFSLYFRGPADPILPQRIYELGHRSFAAPLPIFIVPVGRRAEGVEYEAVFT